MENKQEKKHVRVISYHSNAMFFAIMFLAIFGCIMITSATMGSSAGDYGTLINTIAKQVIFVLFGFIIMQFANYFFKVSLLKNNSFMTVLLCGTLASLVVTRAFSSVNGAYGWIQLGLFSIQPAEFAKISLILFLAYGFNGGDSISFDKYNKAYFQAFCFSLLCILIVLVWEQDFGSSMVMACICFACLMVVKDKRFFNTPLRKTLMVLFKLAIIAVLVILISPIGEYIINNFMGFLQDYQRARILSARDPFIDQYDTGYQLINGLIAFASGGLKGVGFGNSVRKFTGFPAANTDYILSIIVEELGVLGYLCVLIPYVIIIGTCFKYAYKIKMQSARIILIGISAYIFVHFLFNVGGETGLIPLTGVPLLMLSQGGSSAASTMLGIGIAQAIISRYKMGEIE